MKSQNCILPNGLVHVTEIPPLLIDKLHLGGVVVFPTSTQPGLACLLETESLNALFSIKSRDVTKPVSIGVSCLKEAIGIVHVPEYAVDFVDSFPAGSVTLLLDALKMRNFELAEIRLPCVYFLIRPPKLWQMLWGR